ncbi:hypothetical protein EHQ81_13535 [Leptospira selangorensis]|uniref:Adenylate/guanylate cyclase domain-containing protein n=1 Tax=Leptospira selangorensis TaxID=2484982 RepID=A0A5F2BXX2_9LEPT|nr:hypothetical protein [Leptospira selangorensis]TGM12094.1 hypothetical protein EHQ81_13535 [Leptospira selangorensis]TGM14863.1 hypothetical protein EHQ82_19075 [Leptospira selangorensis]
MSDTTPSLERKIVLFLSADIVGSTEYKNKSKTQNAWLRFFTTFYKDFPTTFLRKLEEVRDPNSYKPEVWKSLGDEIIFKVEIKKHEEAQEIVKAFACAVFDYSASIREESLSLKGSAWIAGFPVINAEFATETNSKNVMDFIGPQMDIGFRIGKYASELKFIISVELLILLAETSSTFFKFHLEEPQILKGVLNQKPYPILWIKNDKAKENRLNSLMKLYLNHCETSDLNEYCREFLLSAGKPFMIPYLTEDLHFQILPEWYEQEYEQKRQLFYNFEDDFGEESFE